MKKVFIFFFMCVLSLHALATDYYLENLNTTDVYVRSSVPDSSFDTGDVIIGGWGDMYIGLIKFNVSTLPAVPAGGKVSVWFYNRSPGGSAQPTQVQIGLLASDFNSATTWNNASLSWYTSTVRAVNVSAYGYWTEFDITDYFNYWKQGVANYGFALLPVNTNNYFNFFSSSSTTTPVAQKPIVRFTSPLVLQWPLATSYASRQVSQAFGADWAGGSQCPVGVIKKHNGTDYQAIAGTTVYAAEAGVIKEVLPYNVTWAQNVVIEHTAPTGAKYTTVSWHVSPYVSVGSTVTKGYPIATVANLGNNTHFHFGMRWGAYVANVSGTGALPQSTCTDPSGITYPAFPAGFVDPETINNISFQ